jgi:hypothetical protein
MNSRSRSTVLRVAASFAWSDLELHAKERSFLTDLADELDVELDHELLARPPPPESIDPTRIAPELADRVRAAALRAIAADGRVRAREMEMFDLLDELLPRVRPRARAPSHPP